MDQSHLYQQIVESIRDDILSGVIKPGASLPPMRKMTKQWNCTTGTIMRAYQELAHQGLIVSHVGKGTKVVENLSEQNQSPLRRASLFNRTESFCLRSSLLVIRPTKLNSLCGLRWIVGKHSRSNRKNIHPMFCVLSEAMIRRWQ